MRGGCEAHCAAGCSAATSIPSVGTVTDVQARAGARGYPPICTP